MTGQPESPAGLSFERDIRPMFREKDRDSMLKRFDLWSHSDVQAHQDAILERLRNGTMPCDGAWPPEHIGRLPALASPDLLTAGPARLVPDCHSSCGAIRRSWLVMYLVEPGIDGASLAACDG